MTEQQTDLRERELDYWMTRAYEAEGKLWEAEARIKAVYELLDENPAAYATVYSHNIRRALEG